MPVKKKKQKQKKKRNIIVNKYITIKRIIKNENIQPRNENQVILPQSWNTTNSMESRITNALRDELIHTNNQFKTAYERQKEFNIKVNDNIGDIENHRIWEDSNKKTENKQIQNQLSNMKKRISKYASETPEETALRKKEYARLQYQKNKYKQTTSIQISHENALTQQDNKEQPQNALIDTPTMQFEEKD